MAMHKVRSVTSARQVINSGDVLLWRGQGFVSRMIAAAGRSDYSHAAIAAWWGDKLMVLEVRERVGGRCVTLESQVGRYPNAIDVFSPCPQRRDEVDFHAVVDTMKLFAGCDYGYMHLWKAAMLHLPVFRIFANRRRDSKIDGAPFCSEAVDRSYISGGLDLVPRLQGRLTEPGDLSRSAALEYVCTLGK